MRPNTALPTVIRMAELTEMLNVHRSTIDRWVKAGHFPPPLRLGERVTAWKVADVEAWIDQRPAAYTTS